jgi:hypothetical protein
MTGARANRGKRGRSINATGSLGAITFTLTLFAFTVVLLVATRGLRPSAAVVPRAVGLPLVVLLGYHLIRETLARRRSSPAPVVAKPERESGELVAVPWLLLLPALATLLGFVAGPAIWVVVWLRIRARESLAIALAAGAFSAVAIVALFAGLLGTRLPQGIFGALL